MIIIACVDDNMGLAFNHRRQSRDSVVRQRILDLCQDSRLWMNPYSAKLFDPLPHVAVDEAFLSRAGPGEFCLVEDVSVGDAQQQAEGVVLFRWGRVYPADLYFDIDLQGGDWLLQSSEQFPGTSHDLITMEVYTR